LVLILIAAVALVYCRTLHAPTHYDDDSSLSDNPSIRALGTAFSPPPTVTVGGRPILNLSLAASYALSGDRVWGYHVVNIAIHALAVLALFGIARRTLEKRTPWAPQAAFMIALLWGVHPLQTESVTYIIQRAESLMGLFLLLALYCFIRGTDAATRPVAWLGLSVASCLLGMGTKEVMVCAPVVILLYDIVFISGSFPAAVWRRKAYYSCLGATWVVLPFLVLSTHGRGGTAGFSSGISSWRYLMVQVSAVTHYLRLSVWPHPLVFDYGPAVAPASWALVPKALFLLVLAVASVWAVIRRRPAGFLGAAFFVALAPSSSFVPVASELMAEHRMYLPLAAVAGLVVVAAFRWLGRAAPFVLLASAIALGWAAFERNELYLSDLALWQDTVAKEPGNPRAHNDLGIALLGVSGGMAQAQAEFREALRLEPGLVEAEGNLGSALNAQGRTEEAVATLRDAVHRDAGYAPAHNNLGLALSRTPGGLSEAMAEYRRAIEINPDYGAARNNLGAALAQMPAGLDEAIGQFRESIRAKPSYTPAYFNLGNALMAKGDTAAAAAAFRQAARLQPQSPQCHLALGAALMRIPGADAEAAAELRETLRLQPGNVAATSLLGQLGQGGP
jgi:tetratricopeptide (TPR) repeat protein